VCKKPISKNNYCRHLRDKHGVGTKREYNVKMQDQLVDPIKDYIVEKKLKKTISKAYGKCPEKEFFKMETALE